ncbi:hypothetical protein [Thermoanaerobacterium sp. DL9XJH110]|uniref:hypothetical protein n=1 Tax=Thermoanaerobacterium sp. DL9XJH110 TaxID=3386643 RepID=UPI003BB6F250
MSVKPIDIQIVIPKTTEASKMQQVLKESGEAQQSLLSAQFQRQLQSAKQRVYEREKSEKIETLPPKDLSERRQQEKKKKDKQRRSEATGHIDIKV